MKNILITGSSGFVGKNLSRYFIAKQYHVQPLYLRDATWQSAIAPDSQAILHLAGKAHDVKNTSRPEEYFETNTQLTKELFDVFLASNCRDFIFFSSIKAVTDKAHGTVTEETNTNPKTVYGESKWQAEQYILGKILPEGKRVFVLRPCMIHGPGNKGNLNLLFQLVQKGIPWPLGAFQNLRSFCSIDNVCFVVQQILEREDIPSGIYNIADDTPVSTNRLIELIAASQKKKALIFGVSPQFIRSVAKLCDSLRLPLNSERLEKLTENFVVSNHKIVRAMGKSLPISAEDGLTQTLESFKKQ
ncbi:MAG: NAD-dependent epimerase/dehydratase family protein [Spirosomataceae bacterium]